MISLVKKLSIVKHGQKSVRVVLPEVLYNALKKECPEHGDISKLVRRLLIKHLQSLSDLHEDEGGSSSEGGES